MKRGSITSIVLLILILVGSGVALAAPPAPTAMNRVKQAYQKIDRYQSIGKLSTKIVINGQTQRHQFGKVQVFYDRQHRKLSIKLRNTYIVVDHNTLRARNTSLPGQYLQKRLTSPVTYQKIIDAVQQLIDVPLCPDVAMLLKGDAISALSEGKSHKADAVVAKGKVVGVRFESKLGLVTLQTDDKRGIITRLTIYVSKHNLKLGRSGASSMTAREDIKKVRINKPLPAGAFKFKTKGLTRAKSIKQMVRNNMHK